jgi:hypothetical protein
MAQELAPLPRDARQVSDRQILLDLLADATLYGTFRDSPMDKWSEYCCRNGKAIFVLNSEIAHGRWWIDAPRACFAYQRTDGTAAFCYLTYLLSDGTNVMRSEERQLDVVIQGRIPGDAFKMQRLEGMACEDLSS